jgi:hypothetical protein
MSDPSRPPLPQPRRTAAAVLAPRYNIFATMPPGRPLVRPSGPFGEEEAALAYLGSHNGFAQDLRDIDFSQPPPPSMFVLPSRDPPASAVPFTSHPGSAGLRDRVEPPMPTFLASNNFVPNLPTQPPQLPEDFWGPVEMAGHAPFEAASPISHSFAGPSSFRAPVYPPHYEILEGHSPPQRTPSMSYIQPGSSSDTLPAINPNLVPTPANVAPPARAPIPATRKTATMLILSRATKESIEALEEHKRECPTCCLEFEPDNYMAVITCCSMAMHASCLSVWVNSAGYSKSRACMKCRRPIDAKHPLNKVMVPVSDKEWDEGANFDAPESMGKDAKVELNVTARPHRQGSHRYRSLATYRAHHERQMFAVDHLTSEQRLAILHLREDQLLQSEQLRNRRHAALENTTRTSQADMEANRIMVESQSEVTTEELTAMIERTRETKAARERARAEYEAIQAEFEAVQRSHQRRLHDLLDEFHFAREAREREARAPGSAGSPSARSPAIPIPGSQMPQLRVVNGEPSVSSSPDSR